MKKLSFAFGALAIFFFANPGIAPNLNVHFQPSSPPDVCDCATICKMHLTCDVPKCNGRVAQESNDPENIDPTTDATIDDPQQKM